MYKFLRKKNFTYNNFILLEPTSPLTSYKDIDNAIRVFKKNIFKADALVTVSKAEQSHPVFLVKKDKKILSNHFLINLLILKEDKIYQNYFLMVRYIYLKLELI